jgi:hypothetical protein
MEDTNAVMAKLAELVERADQYYVPVGRKSMQLSDPNLPADIARRFIRDRLSEV